MATYNFRHRKTGKVTEVTMTIAEAEQYEKDNPQLEWMCGAPAVGIDTTRLGMRKPTDAFRDRLKDIKKTHYKSNINTF